MLEGRDRELSEVERLLHAARDGRGGVLVLRGVPGIGKSAVLRAAEEAASNLRVLTTRGIQAEADLPFAAVHQLLHPLRTEIAALPDETTTPLLAAFGSPVVSGQQRFLLYASLLNTLSELASRRPLACLIDDAHWLDSASSDALQFCARRLGREAIAMVFAVRADEGVDFGPDFPVLDLEPLASDVAAAILRRTTDISDRVAARILDQARGNPLAVLELPRALSDAQLSGTTDLPERLPLTAQLESAYDSRIRQLTDAAQQVLLVAATDDTEDLRVVADGARHLGLDPMLLDDAERAGLIRVQGTRLEFAHPLIRSASLGAAVAGERRRAHQALADALLDDPLQADRRAWHLASAAFAPPEVIVEALEAAAARARRRGGHVAAARALERAAGLSSAPRERAELLVRAAHDLSAVGRDKESTALTADIDERLLSPPARASLAFVRASAAIRWSGRPADAIPALLSTAGALATDDPVLAMRLLPVATFAAWQSWDHESQLEVAEIASEIELRRVGPAERQLAVSIQGFAALLRGDRPGAIDRLAGTVRWGRTVDDAQQAIWAAWAALWIGDDRSFSDLLRHAIDLARRQGELGALTEALGMRSVQLALIDQRYDESTIAADEAVRLAREVGGESLFLLPSSAQAIVAAVAGDPGTARQVADGVVRYSGDGGHPFRTSPARYALGLVSLSSGDWAAALDHLEAIKDRNDPALAIAAPEVVEAAVRAGRPERATVAFGLFERRVEEADDDAQRARLHACRALLEATRADAHFEAAIELSASARPFDRPRIHQLYGEHLRRVGRRREAREHLRAAIDGFEALGARSWADRVLPELEATGETARRRRPDTATQLTPQEAHIARLVAGGLTNKEVAAQLYLSPRTIDAHLRGVFAKLGITSRRELRAFEGSAVLRPTGPAER